MCSKKEKYTDVETHGSASQALSPGNSLKTPGIPEIFCTFFLFPLAFLWNICYNGTVRGESNLRTRQQALGDRNIVGAKIEQRRKDLHMKQKDLLTQLQINGVDLNASGLSKLEGQYRLVTDIELKSLARALDVSVNWLLGLAD